MVVPSASLLQQLEWELQPVDQPLLDPIPERPASGPIMRYCQKVQHKIVLSCIFTKLLVDTTYHFPQICGFLQGTKLEWIEDQRVPYAVKGGEWVGFDTKESFEIKVLKILQSNKRKLLA